ncbi:MAG: hypothetical protein L0206_05815 [Actinobacteria bacterium]|nr:hypothetical protein [Actinomycetota bacterium]
MSQQKGFDMKSMSTAHKILLGAGILYLINLFLPWQSVDLGPLGSFSENGIAGIGIINLLLAIGLVAWEGMSLAGVEIQAPKALVSAALAGAIVVFTLLKIMIDNEAIAIFAWIGLILAAVIGYGGYMRWQEHQAGGGMSSPPPTMPGAP